MYGGTGPDPRLIVGISRSAASWWALAWAVGEARRRGARLLLVHVFRPAAAPYAEDYRSGVPGQPRDPYGEQMEHGYALIHEAIAQAVGWLPGDIAIEQQVLCGRPARELARLAQGDDVIVLGARHRGLFAAGPGLGGACLRAARRLPGRRRARTVGHGARVRCGGRPGARPLAALGAAPRRADGPVTGIGRLSCCPRMTSTGHGECWAQCWLTDPSSNPANPPCPRLPTASRSAPSAASSSTRAGCPSTTRCRTVTPLPASTALSTVSLSVFAASSA